VEIRAATAADAADLAELLGQLGYPSTAEQVVRRLERIAAHGGQHTLVADAGDGRVVGMTTLAIRYGINTDAPSARLVSVVVDEDFRSKGVGGRLIAEAERIAREAGCGRIEVTSGSHRERAHRFYERLGYEVTSKRFIKELST
jgi:GNAT superfamily N-acetyltransferase